MIDDVRRPPLGGADGRNATSRMMSRSRFLERVGLGLGTLLLSDCRSPTDEPSPDEPHDVGTYGTTENKEAAVQAAIDAAKQSPNKVVFVSRAFFGYDASRVRFESSVHMTREGHVTTMKDVLAYGALGDGERDDTAAIQAAIASVGGAGERTVFLPPQVFNISDRLEIERSDVGIVGAGCTIRQTTSGRGILHANGQRGVLIDGLRLEGTLDTISDRFFAPPPFKPHGIFLAECSDTIVRNCTIVGAEQDAIKIAADLKP